MYWVSAVSSWVFVKFILGNSTFPLYFLYKVNYFNRVFIISIAFCYPLFEKQLGIQEKQLGKLHTPKSSLSVSLLYIIFI